MPFLKAFEELARLRVWLFLYATRLVEFINALLIISFSTAFLVDAYDGHIDMYATVGYSDFAVMTVWHWGGVWAFGLCQIIAMCFSSRRCPQFNKRCLRLFLVGLVIILIYNKVIYKKRSIHE